VLRDFINTFASAIPELGLGGSGASDWRSTAGRNMPDALALTIEKALHALGIAESRLNMQDDPWLALSILDAVCMASDRGTSVQVALEHSVAWRLKQSGSQQRTYLLRALSQTGLRSESTTSSFPAVFVPRIYLLSWSRVAVEPKARTRRLFAARFEAGARMVVATDLARYLDGDKTLLIAPADWHGANPTIIDPGIGSEVGEGANVPTSRHIIWHNPLTEVIESAPAGLYIDSDFERRKRFQRDGFSEHREILCIGGVRESEAAQEAGVGKGQQDARASLAEHDIVVEGRGEDESDGGKGAIFSLSETTKRLPLPSRDRMVSGFDDPLLQ
jgi:hypothetical protein